MFVKSLSLVAVLACFTALPTVASQAQTVSDERKKELTHIVKQDCGSCHGMTLKGGLGTPLLPDDLKGKHVDFLTHTIMHGRPTTAMPPWNALLTQSEARWIALQLKRGNFTNEK